MTNWPGAPARRKDHIGIHGGSTNGRGNELKPPVARVVIVGDRVEASAIKLLSCLVTLALGAVVAAVAANADEAVDIELVLAVDVSRSIDGEEARLQREGYIAALLNPTVIGAIRSGFLGRIAVAYFEWAGYGHNKVIVDWTLVHDEVSAGAFAAKLAEAPLESARRTSISGAIDFAVPMFGANGYEGTRRVIDISGDGPNNLGRLVTGARDEAVAAGIAINGLPIVNDRPSMFGWPSQADVDLYYVNCVIGGPGAFVVIADGIGDFASAILKKMILEIAGTSPAHGEPGTVPARPVRLVAGRIAPPCDIGEQRFQHLDDDY